MCPLRRISLLATARYPGRCPVFRAFTLIELLVVIAIVTVLVGILVPSLAAARASARQTKEMATSGQLMIAYQLYANDARGQVMPGYGSVAMGGTDAASGGSSGGSSGNGGVLRVVDEKGGRLYGQEARRYPWRILPYLDFNFRGLYDDERTLERYKLRSDFLYVVSLSPSLGINADFVGGKGEPGFGFNQQALSRWGKFYISRMDEARDATKLVVFTSARGVDPDGGSVAGFHTVDSPHFLTNRWSLFTFDPSSNPVTTGGVDFRWNGGKASGRAVTGMIDGHSAMQSLAELSDMRKWSNQASRADWVVGP